MIFEIIDDFAKYGLSTLHCGINFVKAILKIAAQQEIRVHDCRGKQNKLIRDIRKKRNAELLSDMGIRVENWFNVDGIFFKVTFIIGILKIRVKMHIGYRLVH